MAQVELDPKESGLRYYLYLLHEVPIKEPYYCKIGITQNPLSRLDQLQAGNPRPLRPIDYSQKPNGDFGFPLPTREHAVELEARLLARFDYEGMRLRRDFDYERLTAPPREWIAGLHPDKVFEIIVKEWVLYRKEQGIVP